jgi:SNF2 family DNA or RNA helicase
MLIRKSASQTQTRNGAEELRVLLRDTGVAVAMSGTPFRGKPFNLWGTLNWLRPRVYTNQWGWIENYWETQRTWGGGKELGKMIEGREQDLYREQDQIMLRQTKLEVAPDMPAKTYVGTPLILAESIAYDLKGKSAPDKLREMGVAERDLVGVWLPMDPHQERLYRKMEAEGVVALEGGEVNTIGVLAEMTRLKQFATASGRVVGTEFVPALPSNKFEHLMELLEEWGFPDAPAEKVVVVSQFTQVLELFQAAAVERWTRTWRQKNPPELTVMLTGNVTGQRREAGITAFNQEVGTDSPHVMFLNVKAGGVAITLDTADHMVILDETWVVDDQTQVEDRIHRVSRPRPVFYHYLRSLGSIEEHIAATNAEWAAVQHQVLDGRRGVEFARSVLERMGR